MSEDQEARRRAAIAKVSEIFRAAATEMVGPGASIADFEDALMALRAELLRGLRDERQGAPRPTDPPRPGPTTRRPRRR